MSGNGRSPWAAGPGTLFQLGVLGINARNLRYLAVHNPRWAYPVVDDKLRTKEQCEQHGIPVPETYAAIYRFGDVRRFMSQIGDHREFVVKPARGAEGRGILVIVDRNGSEVKMANGSMMSEPELCYHVSSILSGLYSLGARPDRAIIEERLITDTHFRSLAVEGTPDIRTIVYRGVPVMAMLRLPTRASRGRANLHQGAIGVGIDLTSGRTIGGVCRNRTVSRHPDTGVPIAGLEIPAWNDILSIAARLCGALELGYVGVDIVLDDRRGPIVLEANARPGLAVQIANRTGLLARLRCVDESKPENLSLDGRLTLARELAAIPSDELAADDASARLNHFA